MLFLNMSSTAEKTLNKIVGEKNGTQIVLYGHMDERHKDRLSHNFRWPKAYGLK